MEHLERAAPGSTLRLPYLDRATACPGLPSELREKIDAAILQNDATRPTAVLRQARRLSSSGRIDDARAILERAVEHDPSQSEVWVAIIRSHLDEGDTDEAESVLVIARSKALESRSLTEMQARIEAARGQVDAMRATLTRLRGRSRGDATLIAKSFLLQGQLEGVLGHVDEALAAYEAADMAQPRTPALEYAAQLALRSGRPTYALGVYRTLCGRDPGGTACVRGRELARKQGKAPGDPPIP